MADQRPCCIGVDLMGSESSPESLFEAVAEASQLFSEGDRLVAFATPQVLQALANGPYGRQFPNNVVFFEETPEFISMEDSPLYAVRTKKASSLVSGIRKLKEGSLDAFVSAGNTGALIASASLLLPMLRGVSRPALLASLPTRKGVVTVLDVGGNVSLKAEHLLQFAKLGVAYHRCVYGVDLPKVGLLNIGTESKKGTQELQQVYAQLAQTVEAFTFAGNIEGRQVYSGEVDVLVTDGFTGNIFLKTSEGVSAFLLQLLREAFAHQDLNDSLLQVLKGLENSVDYEEFPGALVCGVDGVVIKCHGSSTSRALLRGIRRAAEFVKRDWLSGIKRQLYTDI